MFVLWHALKGALFISFYLGIQETDASNNCVPTLPAPNDANVWRRLLFVSLLLDPAPEKAAGAWPHWWRVVGHRFVVRKYFSFFCFIKDILNLYFCFYHHHYRYFPTTCIFSSHRFGFFNPYLFKKLYCRHLKMILLTQKSTLIVILVLISTF